MKPNTGAKQTSETHLPLRLARRARIAIIYSNYYRDMTERLRKKCVETLLRAGTPAANIDQVSVPGCFEIPFVAQRLAAGRKYHALVALGIVIRGRTHHFDLVASECARGVMQVSLKYNTPVVFEVLATDNRRDALLRAGNNSSNKGIEAAQTALSLLNTLHQIGDGR